MPQIDYRYAYLLGNLLILLPIWVILLLYRKDLIKELLLMSLAGGIIGPISELYYTRDYWRPALFNGWKIGIEDFLFGFLIVGISAVIYEEVVGQRFTKRHSRQEQHLILVVPLILAFALIFHALTIWWGVNSIYASIFLFLIIVLIVLYFRRDLTLDALLSGFFIGGVMFLGYSALTTIYPELFSRFWLMGNISGVLVRGIPIEELLWGFSFGMMAGPFYEFMMGLKFARLTTLRKKEIGLEVLK